MSGYSTVLLVHTLEKTLDELGLMMCQARDYDQGQWGTTVVLKPKDSESLPLYSRDAAVFEGTLDQVLYFLRGIEWARTYDEMMKVSSVEIRQRKEQNLRNKQLMETIKNSEKT